tara:strand:+ start:250 stop:1659 length:1410 start_codon:yes stop_codon:yes gene_type:complete
MAKKELVENIVKLYSKLGGNIGDVLGSRSNITFLGRGKNPEPFVEMDINVEAVGALGKSKILEELKGPMGYLTADKLNDVQATKLYQNMLKLEDFYYPKEVSNITDMATRTGDLNPKGLEALRSRLRNRENTELTDSPFDDFKRILTGEDLPPPGSRGGADDIAAPVSSAEETIRQLRIQDPDLADQVRKMVDQGIMSVGNKGDIPIKRANAREFLVEALKKDTLDPKTSGFGRTNLNDVVSSEDVKFITEGGGGLAGDPLFLVEKYFGPAISKLIPSEKITPRFIERLLTNVEDAAGRRPDDPMFDRFTAKLIDEDIPFAEGGRAGYRLGKSVFKGIADIFKKGGDDLVKQEETFRAGPITMEFLENVDPKVTKKFIRTRDTKGPGSFGMYDNISDMPQGLQAAEFISKIRIPGKNQIDYEKAEMFIGGGVKLSGKESVNELIQMFLNAMKSYKSPFAKGGLAKILEV